MQINRNHLTQAVQQHIITEDQADTLWAFWKTEKQNTPQFQFSHLLYYLGGLIAIGAMTLFMGKAWDEFKGAGLLTLALVYGIITLSLTHYFVRRALLIPAGIMGVLTIVMIPLAVFAFQHLLGWWEGTFRYSDYHRFIDWRWLLMELATLAGASVLLWYYRLPFMLMPISITLWYMSLDLVPFLLAMWDIGPITGLDAWTTTWEFKHWISLYFGLFMTLFAIWIDIRTLMSPIKNQKDYSFWLYLFGVLMFWGALCLTDSGNEFGKLIYALINIAMILIGSILVRRIFVICGGLGLAGYLGYLSHSIFRDSLGFPIVLSLIGLVIIYLGIIWQRNEMVIQNTLIKLFPSSLQELLRRKYN